MDPYQIFNGSFWRITGDHARGMIFVDEFIDELIRSSEEIESKFTAAGRERMGSALLHSLVLLSAYSQAKVPSDALQEIAERQSRSQRDIAPHLYDVFLECLLRIVQKSDPEYTAEVGEAWKDVMGPGLEYMKSMYDA
jgi:hemoglobin-like flavoprotein